MLLKVYWYNFLIGKKNMITIIINEPPYSGNDKAWNGLRLAKTLLEKGQSINIFLIDKAIDIGKQNHVVPDGEINLEELVKDILSKGGVFKGCKTCITRCSVKNDPLIVGVEEGSMSALSNWVIDSDKVVCF